MKELFSLENGMIDSHFHLLHIETKGLDAISMLEEAFSRGLASGMEIGIVPETFEKRTAIAESFPDLYMASGLYPSNCENPGWRDDLDLLEKHLRSTDKIAALGEIGLDYFHDYGTRKEQQALFIAQLEMAGRLDLPVVIHCREADEDVLACLKKINPAKGGIMHCFSSSPEWVEPFVELGFYISFAGNVTYKKNGILRESAAAVPENRLLAETDAPYLSPQPVRGKTNHPGYIGHTYRCLAETRGIGQDKLIGIIRDNFSRFISLSRNRAV